MKNSFLLLLVLLLTSCTAADFRKSIGVDRPAPDEFLVQPREKLKIPEAAIALPDPEKKPESGLEASKNGREALFGESVAKNTTPASAAEKALISKVGADKVDDSIRRTVEKEHREKTGVFGTERGGTLESILDPFGYNEPVDPVVDAKKENKRIREALKKGKKIDPSKVKSIEPAKENW